MELPPTPMPSRAAPQPVNRDDPLFMAAQELEATFLSEMLKSAGLGKVPDAFGGGSGEDQFASFMRAEQARAMAHAGGIGLAESLYRSLQERAHG